MAAPTAPSAAPVFSWDTPQAPLKAPRSKGHPLFVVAIAAILLLCAVGLWRAAHSAPKLPMVEVLAASRDIPAGAAIGFSAVKYMSVPKKFVTTGMVRSLNDVAGHVSKGFIPMGEPILDSMLFTHGGLSRNLASNQCAITLNLSSDSLVDHSIYPGDKVDVLAVSTSNGKKYTKTICQSVEVLKESN